MIRHALPLFLLLASPVALRAQDDAGFTLTRAGHDTIASEQFTRDSMTLAGTLLRAGAGGARERLHYKVTLAPDGSAPLVELTAWRGDDPEGAPARQNTRVIFKDDSVAVDEANGWNGVNTVLFQSAYGAVPYLNLSSAFLELATRRARATGQDSVAVPFFNLGGGQTVTGVVRRVGTDSATVQIGAVIFRLAIDRVGRILGGGVPAQQLTIARGVGH